MQPSLPKLLVAVGLVIVVAGLLLWALPGKFNWFGRLPGDIRVERENFRFYAPITTMILLSLLLTVVVNLIRKFMN